MNKVVVCCPGNSVTGGPELIHQFVDALNTRNVNASILYYPFDKSYDIPDAYKKYSVDKVEIQSVTEGDLVVVPEVATGLINNFKRNKKFLWWLSVDNYFGYKDIKPIKEKVRHFRDILIKKKMSINEIKKAKVINLVQSQYAKDFLLSHGMNSMALTDYLNEEHLEQLVDYSKKKKQIAYNPKKGVKHTKKLMLKFKEIEFIPIQNMSAIEVKALLQSSMVYIDFGKHPGKDRFPREAAMAGCCIITGKEGSAANSIDVKIPSRYKLDTSSMKFEDEFNRLVGTIFSDFNACVSDFKDYRTVIASEKQLFNQQVEQFIKEFID